MILKKFSFLASSFSLLPPRPPETKRRNLDPMLFGIGSFRYVEHYFMAEITEINPLIKYKLITFTLFVFLWESGTA